MLVQRQKSQNMFIEDTVRSDPEDLVNIDACATAKITEQCLLKTLCDTLIN
jgi:hypothetical protein